MCKILSIETLWAWPKVLNWIFLLLVLHLEAFLLRTVLSSFWAICRYLFCKYFIRKHSSSYGLCIRHSLLRAFMALPAPFVVVGKRISQNWSESTCRINQKSTFLCHWHRCSSAYSIDSNKYIFIRLLRQPLLFIILPGNWTCWSDINSFIIKARNCTPGFNCANSLLTVLHCTSLRYTRCINIHT